MQLEVSAATPHKCPGQTLLVDPGLFPVAVEIYRYSPSLHPGRQAPLLPIFSASRNLPESPNWPETHKVAQAGLELFIFLPPPLKYTHTTILSLLFAGPGFGLEGPSRKVIPATQ